MRAPRTQDSCPFRTHPAMNTLPEGRIALSGRESGWSIPYQCLNDNFTISWWAGLLPFTCFYIIISLWFCVDRYEALTCTCHFLPEPESSLVFFIEQLRNGMLWNGLFQHILRQGSDEDGVQWLCSFHFFWWIFGIFGTWTFYGIFPSYISVPTWLLMLLRSCTRLGSWDEDGIRFQGIQTTPRSPKIGFSELFQELWHLNAS